MIHPCLLPCSALNPTCTFHSQSQTSTSLNALHYFISQFLHTHSLPEISFTPSLTPSLHDKSITSSRKPFLILSPVRCTTVELIEHSVFTLTTVFITLDKDHWFLYLTSGSLRLCLSHLMLILSILKIT